MQIRAWANLTEKSDGEVQYMAYARLMSESTPSWWVAKNWP